MIINTQCHHDLAQYGYFKSKICLTNELSDWVSLQQWDVIDRYFAKETAPNGSLFNLLQQYDNFQSIEYIISLREAKNEWEEDGIWHDDGSRLLAFSVSLMNTMKTEGGNLLFRKKGSNSIATIPPFNTGEIIIFRTGVDGYEHKVTQVTSGQRLVVAGWCS